MTAQFTEEIIVKAARIHKERTGWSPNKYSGPTEDFGFTKSWEAANQWLRKRGTTLKQFLVLKGVCPEQPPWTMEMIEIALRMYHADVNAIPTAKTGNATKYFGFETTWAAANQALRNRRTSLYIFSATLGLVNPNPPWSKDLILDAAVRYFARMRKRPSHVSGDATKDFGYPTRWNNANGWLFRQDSSLARLLAENKHRFMGIS
jgi:hypothetical protein